MQEWIWQQREWGRTANYVVPPAGQENQNQNQPPPVAPAAAAAAAGGGDGIGLAALIAAAAAEEDEEMQDVDNAGLTIGDLEQFQWP